VSLALQKKVDKMQAKNPNMIIENLPQRTHAKAFLIKRADGSRETLFGSHNFTSWTVRNGTRELAMWSQDPDVTTMIEDFLGSVRRDKSGGE